MPVRSRLFPYLLLVLLSAVLFVPGQASLPPFDRDESRYLQATTQMFETGNFVDIRFQDQPRYLQPAGIYWLQAASVALFGEPGARPREDIVWAHRIPSLVGATVAVLLTAWIGNLLFGAPTGFVAAVLLASSVLLGVEARMAKIDAVLLAAILAALAALAKIYLASVAGRDALPRWAALFWLSLGAGLMLKGPIILLVVLGTVLLLTVVERRAAWLRQLRPVWGVPLMLAVVLPWLIAIGIASGGEFFEIAIGKSLLGKVATGQQSHGAPPGYYLAAFPLTFWPGSLFAALAVPFVWARRRDPAVRFCLCWIAPTWIVFELVVTKLPHYVLPTYPAIACLAAAALLAPITGAAGRWALYAMRAYAGVWLLVGVALAGLLPLAAWVLEARIAWVGILTALAVALLVVLTLRLLNGGRRIPAVSCAAAAALVLFASSYAWQLPRLRTIWISPRVADSVVRVRPCAETIVASTPFTEPSLVFLLGTRTVLTDVDGAAKHLLQDPDCALALVGADRREAFLRLIEEAGFAPVELDRIRGLNYSNGRRLELILYGAPRTG
ncbi:MAG: ArnT family glycosyltransferase [Alphaproteobacteria bacterium]